MKKNNFKDHILTKIKVVGVGGAGGNAVSRMFNHMPRGVDLVAINTDLQDLEHVKAKKKIQIGKNVTRGLGTGMNPELGKQSAEENRQEITEALSGADMIFITAGLGGGSGTGGAPVVAEVAREMGILTVAVVTKPFGFEGAKRMQIAEEGLIRLRDRVDTLITIPNDKIFSVIAKNTSLTRALEEIDEVLKNSVLGITELITLPGIVNIDFADVKTIIQDGGQAFVGMGVAAGENRAEEAVNLAVNSPLLEISIEGAKGILFSISGRSDIKMSEINSIAQAIAESVDSSAKIIFGTYHDRRLRRGEIKVILVAVGFNGILSKNTLFSGISAYGDADVPLAKIKDREPKDAAYEEKSGILFPAGAYQSKQDKEVPILSRVDDADTAPEEDIWEIPAFLRSKKRRRG